MISFGSGSISYGVRTPLRTFVQDMLTIADQKTVWNSIERTVRIFNAGDEDDRRNTTDGINMYPLAAEILTDREKREIMREGFNNYTHDFFLRRQDEIRRNRIIAEERWCFYVARDSHTLKRIGSEMDNCVGWGYSKAVRQRKATIVYAMHKNKYKICIEVTPDFSVRQAFGPRNSILGGEAFEAYSEWCKEKHIVWKNVFRVAMAPQ